jgi:hypothetical protein
MGLLDDAIREHLELKRRRGADPAEVAKQEREALGPVRDGAAAGPEGAAAPAGAPLGEAGPEPPPATGHAPPAGEEPPPGRGAEPEPDHLTQPTQHLSAGDVEGLRRDAAAAAPPEHGDALRRDAAAAAPPEHEEALRRDAAAAPPEDVVPADDEPEGEDVLDETPDFLQEAPEHDRLWFEQRPPRDFDF